MHFAAVPIFFAPLSSKFIQIPGCRCIYDVIQHRFRTTLKNTRYGNSSLIIVITHIIPFCVHFSALIIDIPATFGPATPTKL